MEYVLIGATAMGLHGIVRATEDIDLFIRATPKGVDVCARMTDDAPIPRREVPMRDRDQNSSPKVEATRDFDGFVRHCASYWTLAPRGVFRFRTLEEAQRARERHTLRSARS